MRQNGLVAGLLLVGLLPWGGASATLSQTSENRVSRLFSTLSALPDINARLVAASEIFLGAPYVLDPLGEGAEAPDSDPVFRFDAFDCQTFIETVIALEGSTSLFDFARRLISIRYLAGRVSYAERGHFVEAQWMPRNIRAGVFDDITEEVGGGAAKRATVVIDSTRLEKPYQKFLEGIGEEGFPVGAYEIAYLPLEWAIEHATEIPSGTVLQIVREPKEGVPHAVTHQGFVLEVEGARVYRNASSSAGVKKVIDRDLVDYLVFNKTYFSKAGRWRVLGVNLLRINERK